MFLGILAIATPATPAAPGPPFRGEGGSAYSSLVAKRAAVTNNQQTNSAEVAVVWFGCITQNDISVLPARVYGYGRLVVGQNGAIFV